MRRNFTAGFFALRRRQCVRVLLPRIFTHQVAFVGIPLRMAVIAFDRLLPGCEARERNNSRDRFIIGFLAV
ncbi:hypothetical protein BDE36_4385 [Arcticibacter tournemirensis]|uniref:Uncharacterized protein n=1 Tax=Arcticibacter tournemirensis TaxID=699437 RepID=A0A5M9H6N1_9SPHI|nr:hypothetical protein [Arcticibacter tournemirensis]KAA8482592.1 hypothetical protein F1649_11485 [Arcticibacter tournemirensis]TQM52564.1 hypothetical protein BDE36_4385 [Arcticibacter tournemirensis]